MPFPPYYGSYISDQARCKFEGKKSSPEVVSTILCPNHLLLDSLIHPGNIRKSNIRRTRHKETDTSSFFYHISIICGRFAYYSLAHITLSEITLGEGLGYSFSAHWSYTSLALFMIILKYIFKIERWIPRKPFR